MKQRLSQGTVPGFFVAMHPTKAANGRFCRWEKGGKNLYDEL